MVNLCKNQQLSVFSTKTLSDHVLFKMLGRKRKNGNQVHRGMEYKGLFNTQIKDMEKNSE